MPTAASRGSGPISPTTSPRRSDRPDITITPAEPADLPAIAAVIEAAFAPFVPLIGRRPAPMDAPLAIAGGSPLAARDAAGALVGCAVFRPGPVGELDILAVAPAAQGTGVGRKLLAAAERALLLAGSTHVRLYTNIVMEAAARLYAGSGYTEVGRGEEDGFHRIHFEKALGPRAALKGAVEGLYGRRKIQGHRGPGAGGPDGADAAVRLSLDKPFTRFPAPNARVRLEVGFGNGDHLLAHAAAAPDVGLLGVEPFESGYDRAARHAKDLPNVRLYRGDARAVLDWLPDAALDRLDLLYPDPWPKNRHWKRRFVSQPTLTRIARVLADGQTMRVASDIADYAAWTRAHVAAHPAFALTGDSAEPWPNWPGTRYEAKALREGRAPRYLTLTRLPRSLG